MNHLAFRKRIEALAIEMLKLHDELTAQVATHDAEVLTGDYLIELGQFEAARLVIEDIACHPSPDEREPARLVVTG